MRKLSSSMTFVHKISSQCSGLVFWASWFASRSRMSAWFVLGDSTAARCDLAYHQSPCHLLAGSRISHG